MFVEEVKINHAFIEAGVVIVGYKDYNDMIRLIEKHKVTAILYGLGETNYDRAEKIVANLLKLKRKIIFDAAAILAFYRLNYNLDKGQDILLTPHEGEFQKSFGREIKDHPKNQ